MWVRRPGEGDFSAADYDSLIGKIAFADIKKGEQISKTHLEK